MYEKRIDMTRKDFMDIYNKYANQKHVVTNCNYDFCTLKEVKEAADKACIADAEWHVKYKSERLDEEFNRLKEREAHTQKLLEKYSKEQVSGRIEKERECREELEFKRKKISIGNELSNQYDNYVYSFVLHLHGKIIVVKDEQECGTYIEEIPILNL